MKCIHGLSVDVECPECQAFMASVPFAPPNARQVNLFDQWDDARATPFQTPPGHTRQAAQAEVAQSMPARLEAAQARERQMATEAANAKAIVRQLMVEVEQLREDVKRHAADGLEWFHKLQQAQAENAELLRTVRTIRGLVSLK